MRHTLFRRDPDPVRKKAISFQEALTQIEKGDVKSQLAKARAAIDTQAGEISRLRAETQTMLQQVGKSKVVPINGQRGSATMNATIEKCAEAVRDGHISNYTISQYLAMLEKHAGDIRRPSETHSEAFERAEQTETGRLLVKGIREADEPEPVTKYEQPDDIEAQAILKSATELEGRTGRPFDECIQMAAQEDPARWRRYLAERDGWPQDAA